MQFDKSCDLQEEVWGILFKRWTKWRDIAKSAILVFNLFFQIQNSNLVEVNILLVLS